MKKALTVILSIMLLIEMVNSLQVGTSAEENTRTDGDDLCDDNSFYFETVDRSKYQLSQAQLDAPTDELIDAIMDYPYLVDLFTSSDSSVSAYNSLRESFNGLAELEERADAASVLLTKFIDAETTTVYDNLLNSVYLEALLSLPVYFENLSAIEIATYSQISETSALIPKAEATQSVTDTPNLSGTYSSSSVAFTVNGFSYTRSNTNGSTTCGNIVPLYTALSDYSSTEKQSIAEGTASKYGIDLLGYATSMYNCHSYAWYYSSTSNLSWVSDISPYTSDSHCTVLSAPSVGSIAVYLNSSNQCVHSAIVTSVDGNNVMCKSKWGSNGLFEHHISNVPSGYQYSSTYVKCVFFSYARYHTCSVTIDNLSTHTRVCSVCGWTSTEAHVENVRTGKCMTCGLAGPFTACLESAPQLPEDECSQINE